MSNAVPTQQTVLAIATGTGGAKSISAISKGNPAIITATAHGFANGDVVTLASIGGMTELNGVTAVVQFKTTNTFAIAVDSTSYTTYTSGGTATPQTYTEIGEVKTWSGLDGQANEIDVTHIRSTAKEYRLGLQDFGNFQIELNQIFGDSGQAALKTAKAAGTVKSIKLTYPDAHTQTFDALVKSFSTSGGVDSVLAGTVQFRVTGAVVEA